MSLSKLRLKEKSHLASPVKKQQPLPTSPGVITPTRAHGNGSRVHLLTPMDGSSKCRASTLGCSLCAQDQHQHPPAQSPVPTPPLELGHGSQAGPQAVTQGRGTRHPEEQLQPHPPRAALQAGLPATTLPISCLHAVKQQLKSMNWPLSFLLLALSPWLRISPAERSCPHSDKAKPDG